MGLQISSLKHLCGKRFLFIFVFLLCISIGEAQNIISFPQALPKEVIADIQSLLQASTSQQWSAQQDKNSDKGIILSINTSLNYKTGESCQVNSDGSSYVKFEAPTANGLIYGLYKYLRDLGFKFYLPDPLYAVIPPLKSVFKKTSSMETPFLRIRDFFGTGGFGSGKTDPDHNVEKAWQLWKWRNGFGKEFQLAGHAGETFNMQNAKDLQKNPGWTATPIMKNGNVDKTAKLNYYNDAAVDFFTDWAIRKFTDKSYNPPPPYLRDMVSVEPSDGAGYVAVPPSGSNLKTVSDQVFYAANKAAEKLDRLFPNQPNIGVNLYAYSTHADVPSFPLNPRIYVQIIPYQFQTVAFGPAFIKRWSEKVKRFGLYDYFKYPDASWDMPGGYTLDQLLARAINAAEAGSEGTTYESSYSKFSTAIPLWVLIQYMCTGDADWKKNYDQLITDLYGSASPAIKNLFDVFYFQPQFGAAELSKSLNDINEAQNQTKDPQVLARINELNLYLTYAGTYLKSQDLANGDLEQRMLPVEKMAWTLYQKKVIDSYRIMQLVSYGFLNAKTDDKNASDRYKKLHLLTFPESKDPDAYWKKDYSYTPSELSSMVSTTGEISRHAKNATIESAAVVSPEDVLTAASAQYRAKQNVVLKGGSLTRGYFTLYSEKPTTVTVNWSLVNPKDEIPSATISGTDKSYKSVYDYPLKGASGKLSISLQAGESSFFVNAASNTTYTLQLQLGNVFCFFNGSPRGKMNFLNEKGAPSYEQAYYPSYFYIPKNTAEIRYKVQANALRILTPDDKPVETKLVSSSAGGFQLRTFDVPPEQTGKFWKAIISGNYNYQLLNIPDRYFLFEKK